MAGWPLEELGGKTTLEAADTPVMDRLAEKAEIGMASMVPEDMAPGSDTANLSVMGYDPKIYSIPGLSRYSRRAHSIPAPALTRKTPPALARCAPKARQVQTESEGRRMSAVIHRKQS